MDRISEHPQTPNTPRSYEEEEVVGGSDEQLTSATAFDNGILMKVQDFSFFNEAHITNLALKETLCVLLAVPDQFFRCKMLLRPSAELVLPTSVQLPVGMEVYLNPEAFPDKSGQSMVIFGYLPVLKQPDRCKAILAHVQDHTFCVVPIKELRFDEQPKNCLEYCSEKLESYHAWLAEMNLKGSLKFVVKPTLHRRTSLREASQHAQKKILADSPCGKLQKRKNRDMDCDCEAEEKVKRKQVENSFDLKFRERMNKNLMSVKTEVSQLRIEVTGLVKQISETKQMVNKLLKKLERNKNDNNVPLPTPSRKQSPTCEVERKASKCDGKTISDLQSLFSEAMKSALSGVLQSLPSVQSPHLNYVSPQTCLPAQTFPYQPQVKSFPPQGFPSQAIQQTVHPLLQAFANMLPR
jgi:hypothetical protein